MQRTNGNTKAGRADSTVIMPPPYTGQGADEDGRLEAAARGSDPVAGGTRRGGGRRSRILHGLALLALSAVLLAGCGAAGRASSGGAASKTSSAAASSPAQTAAPSNRFTASAADTTSDSAANAAGTSSNGSTSESRSASSSASAAKSSASSGGAGMALDNPALSDTLSMNRKVVYDANITMQVKDVSSVESDILNQVQLAGGYLLQFSDQNTSTERGVNYTLKIPADGFYSFLDQLKRMNPVNLEQSMKGQDVTSQYVDLNARLQAKQLEEDRLTTFMKKATDSNALLKFSDQLSAVEQQIEQLKGQIRYLEQSVAYSTINLRVYQSSPDAASVKPAPARPFGERLGNAWKNSAAGIGSMLEAVLVFLAYALPVLVVLALVLSPLWIYGLKSRRERRARLALEAPKSESSE